eukprot:Hpha_TRINITY_DN16556_c3_g1::TRINITY_DN16556_c3_g1_i1::g.135747::m.135747
MKFQFRSSGGKLDVRTVGPNLRSLLAVPAPGEDVVPGFEGLRHLDLVADHAQGPVTRAGPLVLVEVRGKVGGGHVRLVSTPPPNRIVDLRAWAGELLAVVFEVAPRSPLLGALSLLLALADEGHPDVVGVDAGDGVAGPGGALGDDRAHGVVDELPWNLPEGPIVPHDGVGVPNEVQRQLLEVRLAAGHLVSGAQPVLVPPPVVETHPPRYPRCPPQLPLRAVRSGGGGEDDGAQVTHGVSDTVDSGVGEDGVPPDGGLPVLPSCLPAWIDHRGRPRRSPRVEPVRVVDCARNSVDVHRPELFWEDSLGLRVRTVANAESRLVRVRPCASDGCGANAAPVLRVPGVGQTVIAADGAALGPPQAWLPVRASSRCAHVTGCVLEVTAGAGRRVRPPRRVGRKPTFYRVPRFGDHQGRVALSPPDKEEKPCSPQQHIYFTPSALGEFAIKYR